MTERFFITFLKSHDRWTIHDGITTYVYMMTDVISEQMGCSSAADLFNLLHVMSKVSPWGFDIRVLDDGTISSFYIKTEIQQKQIPVKLNTRRRSFNIQAQHNYLSCEWKDWVTRVSDHPHFQIIKKKHKKVKTSKKDQRKRVRNVSEPHKRS